MRDSLTEVPLDPQYRFHTTCCVLFTAAFSCWPHSCGRKRHLLLCPNSWAAMADATQAVAAQPPQPPVMQSAGAAVAPGVPAKGFTMQPSTVKVRGTAGNTTMKGGKLQYVVIDTAAFIRGVRLEGMAEVSAVPRQGARITTSHLCVALWAAVAAPRVHKAPLLTVVRRAAQNFCTIPEVIQEVKDKRARAMLDALPFDLDVREPSEESVKFSA